MKIDLLGIRGLTVMGDVAEFIQKSQPDHFETALAVLDSTPADDPETARRIETGATIGCFQIESPGMRATLLEIHARSEDDIMAALALYRPGPLSGGLKDAFVRRFKGQEPVKHIHPALAPLLDDTFGVILYQEQVLRIAVHGVGSGQRIDSPNNPANHSVRTISVGRRFPNSGRSAPPGGREPRACRRAGRIWKYTFHPAAASEWRLATKSAKLIWMDRLGRGGLVPTREG